MNALSLFSGIGGIDLACDWAGIKTVAFCEREPFCQKVLRKHWPDIPIYDDVCTLTKERLEADGVGAIDIIHGGYPCQPFSLAGKREGTEDDRHLWPEVFRLIQALNPRWFVGENVAGHITLGLDTVLSDLDSIGYAAETFVIPACAVDARHRRDRVFIVAHSKSEQNRWVQLGRVVTDFTPGSGTKNVADTTGKRCGEARELRRNEPEEWTTSSRENVSDTDSTMSSEPWSTRSRRAKFGDGSISERYGYNPDYWAVEPDVGRVANGIPNRVDRLRALGNAVVPQQIFPIVAAIKRIDDMLKEERV